jgi:hypothetical protein
VSAAVAGEITTEATAPGVVDPVTVIEAFALKPAALTVIVVDPAATPVTRPVDDTEASPLLALDHVYATPVTVAPLAALAVGVGCVFRPTPIDACVGETTTDATPG